jgi:hypothetical protein
VYSFGPSKPPFCVGCALNASGVRNKNKPIAVAAAPEAPSTDRRAEKAQRRADKAEAKASARAMKRSAKRGDLPPADAGVRTSNVPVPKGLPVPASRFAPASADHAVN